MAFTYGTVTNCKTYNGQTRKEYECRLGYQVNSQDTSAATSNITLRLQVRSISSSYTTYGYKQTTTIDGTALSAKEFDMRSTNTWQTFGERTITVSHNSSTGVYSASKSGSFVTTATGTYSLRSGSASVTVAPATIPRYATITKFNASNNNNSSNSIGIDLDVDPVCDYAWYSLNGGSTWYTLTSGDFAGLGFTSSDYISPGTTYQIKVRVRRKDSQLTTDSGVISVTTYARTTASISLSSKTVNSISVSSSCTTSVSATKYRIKVSGGSYGNYQTGATFSGLSPNTTYVIEVHKTCSVNGEVGTAELSVATYNYATLSSASGFNLGDSHTISFSNPAGNNVSEIAACLSFTGAKDDIPYRALTRTSTSYTYTFTDSELDTLFRQMGTSNSCAVTTYLRTNCNGTLYYSTKAITVTLTGNQKTSHINVNNSWKRAKDWVNINGTWKRAVTWVNVNGTWKRNI